MALNPKARELLDWYRRADPLPEAARERALDAVIEKASAPLPPRFDVDPRSLRVSTNGASVASKVAGSLVTKAFVAIVALGVPAAAWWSTRGAAVATVSSTTPARSATVVPAAPAPTAPSATAPSPPLVRFSDLPPAARGSTSPLRSVPPSGAAPPGDPDPAPLRPGAGGGDLTTETPSAEPPPAAGHAGVDEEVQLLTSANRALASGDPGRAIALVTEHRARFPGSALAPARDATRAIALCQSGQTIAGQAAARTFERTNPGSAFLARVRDACNMP